MQEPTKIGISNNIKIHVLRLHPGQDLKQELISYVNQAGISAGSIISGVGSLQQACLRLANQQEHTAYQGKFEIVSLIGTLSVKGVHLHMSISDKKGATIGGHLVDDNNVYTTVEVVILEMLDLSFDRQIDPETRCRELVLYQK